MTVPDSTPRHSDVDRETLLQQLRSLQERLAFYEGFDQLIQDNVAHARELFRLAAQEREAASTAIARARHDASRRETHLRRELEEILSDLEQLSRTVEALSARVARALGEPASNIGGTNGALATEARIEQPVTVVVHGVPSAREALSLQRFVASLPQVADVSAREFVGGVLRLEARVLDQLAVAQFLTWGDARRVEALTERPDLLELELVLREPGSRVMGETRVSGSQGVRVSGSTTPRHPDPLTP